MLRRLKHINCPRLVTDRASLGVPPGPPRICGLFKAFIAERRRKNWRGKNEGSLPSFPPSFPPVRFNSLPTICGRVGGGEVGLGNTLAGTVPVQILLSPSPLHLLASLYKFHIYVGIKIGLNWIKLKYPCPYQQVTNTQTAKISNAPPIAPKK